MGIDKTWFGLIGYGGFYLWMAISCMCVCMYVLYVGMDGWMGYGWVDG